jgi:hypothetical protein
MTREYLILVLLLFYSNKLNTSESRPIQTSLSKHYPDVISAIYTGCIKKNATSEFPNKSLCNS